MASGQKKVIIRRFNDQLHWGYLPQEVALLHGYVELIDPAAHVTPILLTEIKWIAYVRDFNLADRTVPERLDRKKFAARPRTEGVWVRMRLTDGEMLEGLAAVQPDAAGFAVGFDGLLYDAAGYKGQYAAAVCAAVGD